MSWNIFNFRAGLLNFFIRSGSEVVAGAPYDNFSVALERMGCRYIPIAIDNKGISPFKDLRLLVRYILIMNKERPDIFLSWTIKPNIYGSLAARLLKIPAVNNVSGLGAAFSSRGWLQTLVKALYRIALARSACVFFQNEHDHDLFVRERLVDPLRAQLLPGSGVDLDRFSQVPPPLRVAGEGPVFLLVARLLWGKGIGEYAEAAAILRKTWPTARFQLLGFVDVENKAAVPRAALETWQKDGTIEYLGHADDVRPHLAAADCIVLPSYYPEGTPRSLLEAAATGRPIITTDMPGCRQVVNDGVNGWLCKPKDVADLADKMAGFVEISQEMKLEMGRQSRLKAERDFDENIVINAYHAAIEHALQVRD